MIFLLLFQTILSIIEPCVERVQCSVTESPASDMYSAVCPTATYPGVPQETCACANLSVKQKVTVSPIMYMGVLVTFNLSLGQNI